MQAQVFQQTRGQVRMTSGDDWPKWFNSPVSFHEGTLKA